MAVNLGLILLVIGIIAMVVGPIMMLQPNAGQRHQEVLRNRATELGLTVKIVSLPKQATDSELPAAIPMYCLPHEVPAVNLSSWLLLRGAYVHESHFFEQWVWHGQAKASATEQEWLRKHLASLPRSVAAIGCNPGGVCFYWAEAGGEPVLEGLAELLYSYPGRLKSTPSLPASNPG